MSHKRAMKSVYQGAALDANGGAIMNKGLKNGVNKADDTSLSNEY